MSKEKEVKLKQVKSKKRVADHGEVFTNEREVNAMLDLVKQETERIESTFLEPACGDGNFLAEVFRRKLNVVNERYKKSQFEWERYSVIAISSIYGVDILEDNAQECRERLFNIFNENYTSLFKDQSKDECRRSVKYLLQRNILWGDALDFTNPETKQPIIFSEWKPINGTLIKRKDFMFQFLVEQNFQLTFFDENNSAQYFDREIQDYKPIHFLKLGDDDTNEL
jgi:hypothetical protein